MKPLGRDGPGLWGIIFGRESQFFSFMQPGVLAAQEPRMRLQHLNPIPNKMMLLVGKSVVLLEKQVAAVARSGSDQVHLIHLLCLFVQSKVLGIVS